MSASGQASAPLIIGRQRPPFFRRLGRLGLAATLLVGLIAGVTGATYADGEWAETVVTSHHTYNLQISSNGIDWQDTSLDGVTPDNEFEPVSPGALSVPITVGGGSDLIPGVSPDQTTTFYVKNASTLPSQLAFRLEASPEDTTHPQDSALLGLLSFTLAVYDNNNTCVSTDQPVSAGVTKNLPIKAAADSVYRFVLTVSVNNAVTEAGDLDQAATNAAQGGVAKLRLVVTGEDTY
jgi:hypothetical protein